jgi:glycosyltransferase involved in cell wall biosynthesis
VSGLRVEVIIVDDGSTDGTDALLQERFGAAGIPHVVAEHAVVWQRQPNSGACAARNRGLDLASGDFVKFLDSDDWLLPDALPLEVRAALTQDADVLVTGWHELDEEEEGISTLRQCPSPNIDRGIDDLLLGRAPITTAALYRRSSVARLRWNPDCRKAQDWEWAWEVALAGSKFRSLDVHSYVHDLRGVDRIGTETKAYQLSVTERRRILMLVESRLEGTGLLTQERKRLLANYHYKDRLALCRRGREEWRQLWSHCRTLDDSTLPPEPIATIRLLGRAIGRYRAVVIYDTIKRILGR